MSSTDNYTFRKLEDLYDQVQHSSSEVVRKELADKISKEHQQATGHPMVIDEHGNIKLESKEAQACPCVNRNILH